MGRPVERNREVATVLRIIVLLAIIVALFLVLPTTPAVAWSSVPFLLLSALFFDAYRRGRRLLLARKSDGKTDELVEGTRFIAGLMIVHTIWMGMGSGSDAMADGMHAHGMDAGGMDAGGFDTGGDGGGMGGSV